jgi:hypothetical protein
VAGVSSIAGAMLQTPFALREALYGPGGDTRHTGQMAAQWFSSHYRGGNILFTYVGDPSLMFYLLTQDHFPDDAFVTDANGPQFAHALAHPERRVKWIVMNSGAGNAEDRIWTTLHNRKDWRRYFVLRRTFVVHDSAGGKYGTIDLYERHGRCRRLMGRKRSSSTHGATVRRRRACLARVSFANPSMRSTSSERLPARPGQPRLTAGVEA